MLSCFPPGVLDEIWNLIESVSEGFPTYSSNFYLKKIYIFKTLMLKNSINYRSKRKPFVLVTPESDNKICCTGGFFFYFFLFFALNVSVL